MKYAKLSWDEDKNPVSCTYNESYFSIHGGVEEKKHVFLQGNNLPKAWENKENFTICELGFGTGLNFLSTWRMYEKSEQKSKILHFISIENEPLCPKDLELSNQKYQELLPYVKKLLKKYPKPIKGIHYISFDNVKLLLCFGDVKEVLKSLTCRVDVWFMDGFSPKKNFDMWDEQTIFYIKNLSNKTATLTTYSVASGFRNNLQNAGFEIEKKPGFGMKKHMLFAKIKNPKTIFNKPWFAPAQKYQGEKKAIVLGAGIAGSSVAYKLAKNGWMVEVIEKGEIAGFGGSGNHCGVVAPLITKPNITLGKMYEMAYLQALSWYEELGERNFFGVKHYAFDKQTTQRWELRGDESLFTCKQDEFGKYFDIQNAGYVQPYKICDMLIKSSENIIFHPKNEVLSFTQIDNIWEVKTSKNTYQAPVLILALGEQSGEFLPNLKPYLQKIRGQVTFLPKTFETNKPICDKGYICPFIENKQIIGATYKKDDTCEDVRAEDNEQNLLHVSKFLSKDVDFDAKKLGGRVAFRCSSSDRFPIIGGVFDEEFYKNEYKSLPWNKHKSHLFKNAQYKKNLYISTAHSSRGLVGALLGANVIYSMLSGHALPVENEILNELHSGRFAIRRLKRQEKW